MAARMNISSNYLHQDLSLDNSDCGSELTQLPAVPLPNGLINNSPTLLSPDRINVVCVSSARDYSLNIDKALKKKIAACRQVKAEYKVTGGGITGRVDTALSNFLAQHVANYTGNFHLRKNIVRLRILRIKREKPLFSTRLGSFE